MVFKRQPMHIQQTIHGVLYRASRYQMKEAVDLNETFS